MKKMKRTLALMLSAIILIGMMIPVAYAKSDYQVGGTIQENPKTEPNEKLENLEARFEPLMDKIDRMSNNTTTGYLHKCNIMDYASGKWDGITKYYYEKYYYKGRTSKIITSYAGICLYSREYKWRGYEPVTGEYYNDIDVNIDYAGSLDVITSPYFTFAVNYKTGDIEQWLLMEQKDSWKLRLAEGEVIEIVHASYYEIREDKIQGIVFTNDSDGDRHMYWLWPNKKVEKAS